MTRPRDIADSINRINSSPADATAMTIDSSENVGVGTTSPASLIHGMSGDLFLTANSTSADSGQGVYFQSTTSGWATSGAHGAIFGKRVDGSNGYLRFDTRSGGTTAERMRIDSSGNVGIGTTSPSTVSGFTVLEVAGSSNGGFIKVTDGTVNNSFYNSGSVGFIGTQTNHSIGLITNGNERMRISSAGGIGGQTTSPRSDIVFTSGTQVSTKRWGFGGPFGSVGSNDVFYIINESNVGQYMVHGAQTWTAHSDERIKENITDVGEVLPSLLNMRCVKYNLISNPKNTKIGFIAQDWETSFPELIDENAHLVLEDDGTIGTDDNSDSETPVKAMAYTETIPLLLKAIQEQQVIIDDLKARIEALENE